MSGPRCFHESSFLLSQGKEERKRKDFTSMPLRTVEAMGTNRCHWSDVD